MLSNFLFYYQNVEQLTTGTHRLASLEGFVGEARREKLGDKQVEEELALVSLENNKYLTAIHIYIICRRKQG